jgi:hypothetical protein
MERTGVLDAIGTESVVPDLDSAVALAEQWIAGAAPAA